MISRFIKSFGYAYEGLIYTIKTQGNFRFHILAALVAIGLSVYLKISNLEWVIVIFCIALVLFAELINTALETLVDLASPELNPLAKNTKDVAAASVLILALASLIIGGIVFLPYFI